MCVVLLFEFSEQALSFLAQPLSLKDNLLSSISAITSDSLRLQHSCPFHNFQSVNLLPSRKHPCVCQAELQVPPEAAGQEKPLHLAHLKTVMDTGQTIQDQFSR